MNQYSCPDDLSGLKVIGAELRRRLFVEEMGVSVDVEFNESLGHFNYSFGKGRSRSATFVHCFLTYPYAQSVMHQ